MYTTSCKLKQQMKLIQYVVCIYIASTLMIIIAYNKCLNKLMKGKALRKHSLHGKTAASVLLKLFNSGNEKCQTTDTP